MSKITFKRIALVVVATLGLGVLSTGPSSGAFTPNGDTLSLSATSATIGVGETASVTVSASAIANTADDSLIVTSLVQSSPAGGNGTVGFYITDSSLTTLGMRTTAQAATGWTASATDRQQDYFGSAGTALGTINISAGLTSTAATAFSFSARFSFMAPTVTGTYVFRFANSHYAGSVSVAAVPQTFTVTVTANTSSQASATYSTAYMNRADEFPAASGRISSIDNHGAKGIESDSTLVVSAGSTLNSSNSALAVWTPIVRNSSDTKVGSVNTADGSVDNLRVKDSVVVTMTGPGLLAASSYWSGVSSTRAKQVTINWNESVVVYADGTAGVGTITGYVSSLSAANKFAQAAKSITFVGRATTFTVTGYSAGVRAGGTVRYAGAADSATAAAEAIRFLATDAAGNAVTTSALSVQQGEGATGNFFAISSDTSVIAAGEAGATYATSASRRSPALPCTYDSTSSVAGYWYCTGRVFDSGTVTLTIVDSRTVTPNGANYLTSTDSAVYKSTAFSVTFAGAGNTGTITLDKKTYNVNEKVSVTMTCKDGVGRNVADGAVSTCWTGLNWVGAEPTFGNDASVNAAGGRFTDLDLYMVSGTGATNSFVGGVDTMTAYMPTTAGTYKLMGRTAGATADSEILSFTVVDPVAAAQAAAIAASQAAADAATDAALEAIDAANAATDAANLAAEAADAALLLLKRHVMPLMLQLLLSKLLLPRLQP